MTKFFQSLLLVTALSLPSFAQQTTIKSAADRGSNIETSKEDMKRVADAKLYVGTRAQAINYLGLNEEETTGFSPLYEGYVRLKKDIEKRRARLIAEYKDEMAEDDTAKDEENETADFIENYMEIDIAQMELKKDMFDRFEDVIGAQRALDFFAMEDMFAARAKRKMILEALPTMRIYVPVTFTYDEPMADFSNWKRVNINGRVDISHDFTYTGLEKLLGAVEAMAKTEGINVANFEGTKNQIMMKAEKLKENWKSLKHADLAREAFTMTASLLSEVANDSRFEQRDAWFSKLNTTAKSIKPEQKLTAQADTVYKFFDTAEMIVNDLVNQTSKMK